MKTMVHWLMALGIVLGVIVISPRGLQAAGLCSTAPSRENCDGQDPYDVGCWGDKRVIESQYINDSVTSVRIGKVTLYYSPKCKSNFSYVERLHEAYTFSEAYMVYENGYDEDLYWATRDNEVPGIAGAIWSMRQRERL